MDGKLMALMVVVTVLAASVIDRWLKMKTVAAASGQLGNSADKETIAAQAQEISELRQRVEVLEKIVTDKSHRLSQEIDAL